MKANKSKEQEIKPLFEDMGSHTKVEADKAGLKKVLQHQKNIDKLSEKKK